MRKGWMRAIALGILAAMVAFSLVALLIAQATSDPMIAVVCLRAAVGGLISVGIVGVLMSLTEAWVWVVEARRRCRMRGAASERNGSDLGST